MDNINKMQIYKYYSVSDEIFVKIYKGHYRKGSILPAINKLAKELDTSPETIRKALYVLVDFKILTKSKNAFFITNDISSIEEYKESYIKKFKNMYEEAIQKFEK